MPRGCAGRTLPGGPRPPAPRRPAAGGGSARGLRRAHSRPGSWPWLGGLWRARKGATVALAVSPTLIVTLGRDPTGFTQCRRRFLDSSISTTVVPALVAGTPWHQRAAMSCHNGISASRQAPPPDSLEKRRAGQERERT